MRTRSCISTRMASWAKVTTLAAVAILILGLASPVAWAQSPDWTIEYVTEGSQCSLAYAPDNNPSIAYVQNGTVMLAHWNGASWDTETVAVGNQPDLAYDPLTGQAMICYYYLGGNSRLRFARRVGLSWTIEEIDSPIATFPQLACDPNTGRPAIAYITSANKVLVLKLARWSGSSWDKQVVDTVKLAWGILSLAYDPAGNPAISYVKSQDAAYYDLKLARWNPATASWNFDLVDRFSYCGSERISLAFNPLSGYPAITYQPRSGSDLPKIAQWNGANWDIQMYHTDAHAGLGGSLAFDRSGSPHISHVNWFPDDSHYELLVTHWTSLGWMHERLPAGSSFDRPTNLAFHPVSGDPTVAAVKTEGGVSQVIFVQRPSVVQWPPVVSILLPANGASFNTGATVDFLGSANDVEDGDLSAGLVWTSNKDGQIGVGPSCFAILSRGVHTITASATDSGGKTGSATIQITVGKVRVASITYALVSKNLNVTIALVDDLGAPVAGGGVWGVNLYRDGTKVTSWSGYTGADGKVTFQYKNAGSGTYTTTVTNVTATGLAWDGVTPPNSFKK